MNELSTGINSLSNSNVLHRLKKRPLETLLGTIVAVCAFITLSATIISQLGQGYAAPLSGSVGVRAILEYSLTLTLGQAYGDCPARPDGGSTVPISPTPDGRTHYACINAHVWTDNPTGYTLTMHTTGNGSLVDGANSIPATTGTILNPTNLPNDTWGFCIPGIYMSGINNGFTDCGSGEGATFSPLTYAAVPTVATRIRNVTTVPTTPEEQNTPIRFGVRPTATLPVGTYSATIQLTASLNAPGTVNPPLMQEFTPELREGLDI